LGISYRKRPKLHSIVRAEEYVIREALLANFLFGLLFNPEDPVPLKHWYLPELYSITTQTTVLFNKTDDFIV
jgi:hypothetical protein